MPDYERAMLAYSLLADLSERKRQLSGRDNFLMLAAVSACRAGWPEVAERCRDVVLAHNPKHLVRRWDSIADALRSDDFAPYQKRLQRFCNFERAEHLLQENGIELSRPQADNRTVGQFVLDLLPPEGS